VGKLVTLPKKGGKGVADGVPQPTNGSESAVGGGGEGFGNWRHARGRGVVETKKRHPGAVRMGPEKRGLGKGGGGSKGTNFFRRRNGFKNRLVRRANKKQGPTSLRKE